MGHEKTFLKQTEKPPDKVEKQASCLECNFYKLVRAAQTLVRLALDAGGTDNITVVVAQQPGIYYNPPNWKQTGPGSVRSRRPWQHIQI